MRSVRAARAMVIGFGVAVAVAAAGCETTEADSGRDARLQVAGAQFYRGAMPEGEQGGPAVLAVSLRTNAIRAGTRDKPCNGALAREATAAAIALSGDLGYWIVPAGAPTAETPDLASFQATLAFAPNLADGTYQLMVRAVDGAGRFGLPMSRALSTVSTDEAVRNAELAISLRWDTEVDLDLHVVDPRGVEIWKRNINSYERPAPGEPIDPEGWKTGGILDFDSNAACVIDGRRRENVFWKSAPPEGHYVVRVDAFSLCSESTARFHVDVLRRGVSIGSAEGMSTEVDARYPHDRGAGVLALEFDFERDKRD
ncbi:hypothetical protein [Pendulispora albinea]|uniref:Lipoprotein n=1 Tax=Pendulispora albinea TaxID=2741071 RepID=A0ABZ2LPQ9_9BACT